MAQAQTKILCIEDDRETAALIAEELVDRGYDVSVAHDGREGLAAILKVMPDLVLSDISMPEMSGFELLDSLIALAPRFFRMPFVFLTALTDRDTELKGRQLGADDYMTKPIDFEMLGAIISARLTGVARTGLWPKTSGAERARSGSFDLVGARQNFCRDRQNSRADQEDGRFPYRQCAGKARRGNAHTGGAQGGDRTTDRALGAGKPHQM